MRGIVGGEADRNPVAGNDANSKAPHSARQLCCHFLSGFKCDLIAAAAQYLVDTAGGLNEVVSRQVALSLMLMGFGEDPSGSKPF